jgi:hypothetical protein
MTNIGKANIIRKALPTNVPDHVKRRLMGTSADSRAPWDTYTTADPLANCSPELKAEISEYSRKHHGATSSSNVEELCRQKEMSKEMVKEYQFYRQDELLDLPSRKGRVLHCLEFLKMLETIRPAYLSANIQKGLTGLAVYHPKEMKGEDGIIKRVDWHYVCGVQVGYMYEYSVLHVDERGLPLNEKWRGWRTVLLRLIQLGHVTEQQALEVFGEPTGIASRRYREQLYCFRNRKRDAGDKKDE